MNHSKYCSTRRKLLIFIGGGGISIILYLVIIGIYTRFSRDPIIFFASLVIDMFIIILDGLILYKTKLFDNFTVWMICLVYLMGIVILTVFGPTFIDRSISYHIAFYATDKQKVDIDEIKQQFSEEIFDKRIHDAIKTGFIEEGEDGNYAPTLKAKIVTEILKPIGKITGSLDTYENLKESLEK